jgi:hypothetical protein
MDYPYDAGLDESSLALLTGFRIGPAGEADERLSAMIRDDMPADLKAWLHTYAHHGRLVSVGDSWFERDNVQRLGDVVEAFQPDDARLKRVGVDGFDLRNAIVMGNTADGEVFYAAAWKPGDAALTLVKFCCAGYSNDGYHAMGSFVGGLQSLADNVEEVDDIDESVRAVLTADRDE